MDDEYFRTMLALRADLSANPAVEKVRETVLRAFEKPTKKAFKEAVYGNLEPVISPSGDALHSVGGQTYPVSVDRIAQVVNRTTLGLFYKHMGKRLPLGQYIAGANLAVEVDFEHSEILEAGRQRLMAAREIVVAPAVYSYRFIELEFDPFCTVWWHTFYENIDFIAATTLSRTDEDGGNER